MKGLILVHLGSRDEGIKLAKEGLSKDVFSHICWHVWALIQKGEFNYEEAIKAYLQALKCDKVCSSRDLFGPVSMLEIRITSISFETLLSFRHTCVNMMAL